MKTQLVQGSLLLGVLAFGGCAFSTENPAENDETVGQAQQAELLSCNTLNTASINADRELLIRAVDVVEDPCRTTWNPVCDPNIKGKWTFWYLMQQMAGTVNPSTFILKWLESFEETPTVNGQVLPARSKIRSLVINPWRQASSCSILNDPKVDTSACTLDPSKAPFRLLAIVNRMDLRSPNGGVFYGGGNAGEGRLVFGFTTQAGVPLNATAIFEYTLPTSTWSTLTWANKWHNAALLPTPGADYNAALQTITEQFVKAGLTAGAPNNSSIAQVRTNETAFDSSAVPVMELRQHTLQCRPGINCSNTDKLLLPSPTSQTPTNSLNFTTNLRTYLNDNASAILAGNHQVPGNMLAGSSRPISNPFNVWMADDMLDNWGSQADIRRLFGLATCNGCHSAETQTNIFHIAPRAAGAMSTLSGFTAGPITVNDILGGPVDYDEMQRRKCEARWLLNGNGSKLSTMSGLPH